jgi:glycosyltransferase involved in cell wall biosynthesis
VVDPGLLPPQPERERIKVLHVITRFAGGSGSNTLLSAEGMDPERYEVWIAAAGSAGFWERAERSGIRTVPLQRFREQIAPLDDLVVFVQLYRLIRHQRFSVVHTHCAKGGFLGRLAARLARTPVVVHTFHAFAAHPFMGAARRAVYVLLERLVRPMADRYVAVSPRVAREAVELRLAAPGTVDVVPSAIEVDQIPDEPDGSVRRELGIAEDRPVVGWVGRMVPQKAPVDFVRMAALVRRTHPEAVFVMVGDAAFESAPLERRTRDAAARLGLDIVFTGFRPDAPRIASAFDVFVVSSLYEGLGRGLTEAMASGRPVVATAVNGIPDLVEPGSTGLLAPPGDPDGLAACVRWVLDHPAEAHRMGSQARARVSVGFEPSAMCAALDRAYSELLGLPPTAQPDHGHPLVVLPPSDGRRIGAQITEEMGAGQASS